MGNKVWTKINIQNKIQKKKKIIIKKQKENKKENIEQKKKKIYIYKSCKIEMHRGHLVYICISFFNCENILW